MNVGEQKLTVELYDVYSLTYGLINRYDLLVTIAFTPYVPPVIQEETTIEQEVEEDNQITEIPEQPKQIVYKSKDSPIGAKSVIKAKTPDWVI